MRSREDSLTPDRNQIDPIQIADVDRIVELGSQSSKRMSGVLRRPRIGSLKEALHNIIHVIWPLLALRKEMAGRRRDRGSRCFFSLSMGNLEGNFDRHHPS